MRFSPLSFAFCVIASGLCACGSGSKKIATPPPSVKPATVASKPAAVEDELDDYGTRDVSVSDPLEGMNRVTFRANDALYDYLLRPVSRGYEFITPKPARKCISNAFYNTKMPTRVVNSALQGKFKNAGKNVGKFVVDSTAGVGGLFKVSKKIPALADATDEDTGQTLGRWGVGHGPYLVLPLMGSSSARELVGFAGDYMLDPLNALSNFSTDDATIAAGQIASGAENLTAMPERLSRYDANVDNSVDPYVSVRSAYIQNRAAKVAE
jgi:phospholipid-binding lipoprotein MlaA